VTRSLANRPNWLIGKHSPMSSSSRRDCQKDRVCEAVIRKAGTAVLAGKDH